MGRRFARARTLALDISPLRDSPAYRALWIGQIVSLIGSNMRLVAVSWQVFQITGSNVAVGMVGIAEVIPLILVSVVSGTIVDRRERRGLIARTQLGLVVASLGLAVVSLQDSPSLAWIYGLTAVSSALNALERPARTAMLPSLVGPTKIAAAMALRQVVFQVTQIVGPLLGGIVIAAWSVPTAYFLDAVSFLASLAALHWIPRNHPATDGEGTAVQAIREGFAFVLHSPLLLGIFVIDLVAMIFGMPRAVFPALAERTFAMGAAGVGLLYAAPSAGALLGALTTGWVNNVERQGKAVLWAVTVWGAAITAAGLSLWSLPLTLLMLGIAGAADVYSAVFRGTMLIDSTPEHLRGRASAVQIMVVTGGPRLGDAEAGLVAGVTGAPASVVIGGLACLAGTAAVAAAFPALREYRARPQMSPLDMSAEGIDP